VAVSLTADQEALVHFSFPIEKQEDTDSINPLDGTPDILIWGKATDGTVDADRQIVDPEWSAVALKEWLATGGNVRMSHDPKRPVGKGKDVQSTMDGHYVRSLICDPLAKHFIRTGVLNDYSVGISNPHIKFGPDKALDPRGAATGGIITGRPDGQSKIAELSVVDRGANFNSRFQIAKSAGGSAEFVGEMVGDAEEITKAAPAALLTKEAAPEAAKSVAPVDISSFQMPVLSEDLSITFTPTDMARLVKNKIIEQHYDELALKAIVAAEAPVYKRDIDTATRRRLAADGKALPNLSYPIENEGDLHNAAHLARTGHGDAAAARRLIARRARELGVANPLDESDDVKKGTATEGQAPPEQTFWVQGIDGPVVVKADGSAKKADGRFTIDGHEYVLADKAEETIAAELAGKGLALTSEQIKSLIAQIQKKLLEQAKRGHTTAIPAPEAVKEAEPEVTKDPEPADADKPVKKAKKKPKGPKKMPPWLNQSGDGDGDDDDKADKAAYCHEVHEHTEKCHTDPATAAGVTASTMSPAPVGDLVETPAKPHMKSGSDTEPEPVTAKAADLASDPEVAVLLRYKAIGCDEDLGRLHDLTCPAYHPEDVAKYHPFADLPGLIDSRVWQKKTLAAAAGGFEQAMKMQEIWQAALLLKTADMADLNDFRVQLHKAFRDANPGPGSFPTPGSVSPQRFHRPCLTDGRSPNGTDYGPPNTAPQVATTAPNAQSFDRPPLTAAHQSPSPSHMKGGMEYPAQQGVPTQLSYAAMQKEQARQALVRMHEHLSRQFPEACPIALDTTAHQPERKPVPTPAGISKSIDPEPAPVQASPVAAFKATPEGDADFFSDAEVYKAFKKMRKRLGKKVLSGKMTVDEARAKLGRQFTQKGTELQEAVPEVQKGLSEASASAAITRGVMTREQAAEAYQWPAQDPAPVAAVFDPEVVKSAVRDALRAEAVPLEAAEIKSFDPSPVIEAAVTKAMTPLLERIDAQDKALAENQRVLDAIADQPDPSTAAFSGLAFQPSVQKSRRPAGVVDQAEYAARAQAMIRRNLEHTYSTHSNPYIREKAAEALAQLGVEAATPIT
jgi:hypothetical protein